MEPCQTYCVSNASGIIIRIPVEDGSRCYENPAKLDVCVKGKCQVVGCDGEIGSEVVYDNCGICNGFNDTCTMNKGTITMTPEDENLMLECPVGATNILVQEFSDSRNHLVVQNTGAANETFINGGSNVTSPGVYEISGTKFVYSRDENMEKLLALGPIKENLIVKVKKSRKQKVSPSFVKFQYFKPKKEPEVYIWKPKHWLNCSKPCGGGIQERVYECYRKRSMKKMETKFCVGVTKPKPRIRKCNQKECEIRFTWVVTKWESCSVTCGDGMQKRDVYCKRSTYGVRSSKVSDLFCDGKKPPNIQKCTKVPCVARWVAGPWQECSKTCGRGLRTRSVDCLYLKTNKSSWQCTEESKLPTTGYCQLIKCVKDAPVIIGNLSCTFEAGFCRWRNTRREDNFDWSLRMGLTPSRYTGPTNDHTFHSTKGKYIFIEASAPQSSGDKARIISPLITISKLCLDFWYHMLGKTMGTINVYLKTVNGDKKLWHKEGNQGPRWNNARLQITSSVKYRIIFEAVRGNGYSGDAALDDITVYSGKCPKSKYVKTECEGDISRYCQLAVRYQWCSSVAWGEGLCCDSCSTAVKFRQRRKSMKGFGR
ncbi:A disintegrin and metalloproteinase with thrombospondin motifs 19-like [Actinia tenebrosa]|uniref:A disintegrin and metalloproteinase with thrombospondin motifs 19-like n=1 Tax=Actinia tenebrosa TaxID=6105 RepID=A0A6P8J7C1_ACTTE|nr:A disintegrin and metalloproteinase with thrombospondin motifs 19-like [Actinia tenebrosa]